MIRFAVGGDTRSRARPTRASDGLTTAWRSTRCREGRRSSTTTPRRWTFARTRNGSTCMVRVRRDESDASSADEA